VDDDAKGMCHITMRPSEGQIWSRKRFAAQCIAKNHVSNKQGKRRQYSDKQVRMWSLRQLSLFNSVSFSDNELVHQRDPNGSDSPESFVYSQNTIARHKSC
jgi:hypothetical protein